MQPRFSNILEMAVLALSWVWQLISCFPGLREPHGWLVTAVAWCHGESLSLVGQLLWRDDALSKFLAPRIGSESLFGRNFDGMCGSLPDGIWLIALNGARVSRSQSLFSSAQASRELWAGGPFFFFRRTDFSTPTSTLPMKLFLWAEPRPTRLIFHAVNPLA